MFTIFHLYKYAETITLLIVLLLFSTCIINQTVYSEPYPSKRIVGGEIIVDSHTAITSGQITEISQWPWVVALTNGDNQFCGASLIDRQWLLTAAHCVYDPLLQSVNSDIQINAVFMQSDLSKSSSQSFQRKITEIIIHPDYNYNLDLNDIALLKLNQAVDHINPVQLPGSAYDAFTVSAGTVSTVLGWGITQNRHDSKNILRKVELPITEQNICSSSMQNHSINIEDHMICAGYPEGGKDSCSGDSGGPLVYYSPPLQNWVQIGIVSFGISCAMPNHYGVYTRIAKYTAPQQLINETICETLPEIPDITLSQHNQTIRVNFSTSQQHSNFRLYYAPYPQMTPIQYINVTGNEFSATLAENESYFIAAQTHNINCISPFSEIQIINLQ